MGIFSDIALEKMLELSSNTENKVGRELYRSNPQKYKGFTRTDCTTFVLNVLDHTFKKTGQPEAAASLMNSMAIRGSDGNPKFYGDLLFKRLVNNYGWKGIYCTPDRFHPNDGKKEHTFALYQVLNSCHYAGVPVSYTVLNYNPTPKTNPNFQKLFDYKGVQKLNITDLNALNKIKFGVGMSTKGMHNWLFSLGSVYEVHWDGIGSDLYEIRKIPNFPWNSNFIIVPPDMIPLLTMSKLKCS